MVIAWSINPENDYHADAKWICCALRASSGFSMQKSEGILRDKEMQNKHGNGAAKHLGHKNRSQLYKLMNDGWMTSTWMCESIIQQSIGGGRETLGSFAR